MTWFHLLSLPAHVKWDETQLSVYIITIVVSSFIILLLCKSGILFFNDLFLEEQHYFWNYVNVMSWLSDNLPFDVIISVTTPQSITYKGNSYLVHE